MHVEPAQLANPGPSYVTGEDNLRLRAWGSLAGVTLTLAARRLGTDGRVRPTVEQLAASSDRTLTSKDIRLDDGWLTNVIVTASAGSPALGRVFVTVDLIRGIGGATQQLATLAAGYVSGVQGLAWPGGFVLASNDGPGVIRSITGTDPAANTEISDAVPTGARWRLLSWIATLTTDANVANREASLVITDGAATVHRVPSATAQTAGTSRTYQAHHGAARAGLAVDNTLQLPIGNLILPAGFLITTVTSNRQVGDNWGAAQLLVEEWIEP